MKTTTLEVPATNLAQFDQALFNHPILLKQLKTATSPDHFCQLTAQWFTELGYSFTPEEVQALLPTELTLTEHHLETDRSSFQKHSHLCIG